jgi:hypothetical protein
MAEAVSSSAAPKFLLPLAQEAVTIVGVTAEPLPHLVQRLIQKDLSEVLGCVKPTRTSR